MGCNLSLLVNIAFLRMPRLNRGILKIAYQGKTRETSEVTTFSHSKQPKLIIRFLVCEYFFRKKVTGTSSTVNLEYHSSVRLMIRTLKPTSALYSLIMMQW